MLFFTARLLLFLWIVLAAVLPSAEAGNSESIKKVLVLHSYHQGLEWTDSITSGIKSVFKAYPNGIELYFEYLDTKRNAGELYFKQLVTFFKSKQNNIHFDVIIVSDNNALTFIKDYGQELYHNTPIVFCGINNFSKELIADIPYVTGVVERVYYGETLAVMDRLHPDRNHILMVLDRTVTGNAIKKELEKVEIDYQDRFTFEYFQDFTLAQVPAKIKTLSSKDLIYLLTFNRDRLNHFVSYVEGIQIIHRYARVPIYGSWDFYLGKGIVGGMITSGYLQGKHAAELAMHIIRGVNVLHLAIMSASPRQYMFDYNQMKRFNIKISDLPKESKIINRPKSVYEQYKHLIWAGVGILVVLIVSLIGVLFYQRQKQKRLLRINLELDRRVAEKTAALYELTEKLQKISITDALTGINNRRYIYDRYEKEIRKTLRYGTSLSIAMIDIDHFKCINDRYGHIFGDEVLRTVARSLKQGIRTIDILGRYGGEEFLIVLPNTHLQEAYQILERLRESISELRLAHGIRVSISGGVGELDDESETGLLKKVDDALYRAKAGGRNRIEKGLSEERTDHDRRSSED